MVNKSYEKEKNIANFYFPRQKKTKSPKDSQALVFERNTWALDLSGAGLSPSYFLDFFFHEGTGPPSRRGAFVQVITSTSCCLDCT